MYVRISLCQSPFRIRVLKSYTTSAVNVNTLMERRASYSREINGPYADQSSRVTLRATSGQQISLRTCTYV